MFSLRVHPLDDEKSTIHLGIQTWQKHTGLSQEYSQGEIDCLFILSLSPHPPPALNTTLALPSLLSWCLSWLGIPVGCALPVLCSLNLLLCCSERLFYEKMLWTEVNKTSQKQRESWFAKLPALKNEVMWANISSFYGNLSSSVIYGQWPSRSILDNMKVFLA